MISKIKNILKVEIPDELAEKLVDTYYNAICEYGKRNWQYFGNEIGRFVELAIRIVELKTERKYTKLSEKLPIFNETILRKFEQSTIASESFRILIPRQLYSMYCIRNKRGMIHVTEIDPNYMDATILKSSANWILAELVREIAKVTHVDAINLIEGIINRENQLIWNEDEIFLVLDNKIKIEHKILCILYYKTKINEEELYKISEYRNISRFREKLKIMHKNKLIYYTREKIAISPIGFKEAEKILNGLIK